ncbi:hypothetical protein [Xylophilus ampelinus]|uniref:Uncharacterized protein n=1 Tax=Xylophilus ampelinus TaxID=54067 RepID=A0A318SBE9_9BURK|nr:hypothetical protein [Xylophilus ampelinus]MCS4511878.1 hypothetical protein [Xylophilus ampelinus]PYE73016.1 hypothetical protein DFQ15_1414 [Xylophilus ampelinus]
MSTRFLVCTTDANPCPLDQQAWLSAVDALNWADMGLTPDLILKTYGWGFGAVFAMYMLGVACSAVLGSIRKA